MSYGLGVDLGTTFVAVAISRLAQIEMFSLGDRSVVAPAVVYLRDDGDVVTGEAASRRAVSNPGRLGRALRRSLCDETPVMLGGTSRSATDMLATLLHDVVRRVTDSEGTPPEHVVLTHPASWSGSRRGVFAKVPRLAGLRDALTITEAEATATYYAASRRLPDGAVVAVYDLGGGAFEASVVRKRPDGLEILGTAEGIDRLGGIDFDETIFNFVDDCVGGALSGLDPRDPLVAGRLARLRQDCILAKEALSRDVEAFLPVPLPDRHVDVRLTRSAFEDLVRAPVTSTVRALSRTLRSAQVAPDDLSAVLVVGGSARIPLVARMVSEELGREVTVDTHAKCNVALGAARYARTSAQGARGRHASAQSSRSLAGFAGLSGIAGRTMTPSSAPSPPGAEVASPTASRPAVTRHTLRSDGGQGPAHSVVGPEPTVAPRGRPGAAADLAGHALRLRPTPVALVALFALTVAVAFATFLIVYLFRLPSEAELTADRLRTEVVAPAAQPAIVPSVPIPSLGNPIAVGGTPGYVAVSPNGRLAYIANRDAKVVTVVDTSINRVTAVIPVAAGPPQFLTFAPDGRRVYLSIFNLQKTIAAVGVLDTTTNKVVATIPVKTRPFVSAVSPNGKRLYVPNHDSGTISVIDTATNRVVKDIKVRPNPHWIEFSHDGTRAYTANHESNVVTVLDTSTDTVVAEVPVGTSPHSVAVHPNRPLVANVNYDSGSVSLIDTTNNTVLATVAVGKNPQDVTWAPDGRFAYVTNVSDGTVSVIDAESNQVTATIPTGQSPTSVAVLPNGREAYVTNLESGTMSVLNTSG